MVSHRSRLANDPVTATLYSRAELQFVSEESLFSEKIGKLVDTGPPNHEGRAQDAVTIDQLRRVEIFDPPNPPIYVAGCVIKFGWFNPSQQASRACNSDRSFAREYAAESVNQVRFKNYRPPPLA